MDRKRIKTNLIKEIIILQAMGDKTIASLEEQLEKGQKSIDNWVLPSLGPSHPSDKASQSHITSRSQSLKKKSFQYYLILVATNNICQEMKRSLNIATS